MNHWQILDMAATHDIVAVKRAYAKRLKQTRPDDDAAAYQQLREAYDAALREARWRQENLEIECEEGEQAAAVSIESPSEPDPWPSDRVAQTGPAPDLSAPAAGQPDAAAVLDILEDSQTEQDSEPYDGWYASTPDDAEILLGRAQQLWRTQGDAALLAYWPELENALRQQAMELMPWTARCCADFLLQNEHLPSEFVLRMIDYFQWGRDFRADTALGSERALAIHAHEVQVRAMEADRAQRRERLAEVFRLENLRRQGQHLRARCHALLAPAGDLEYLYDWDAGHFLPFGLSEASVRQLRGLAVSAALWKSLALIALLVFLLWPQASTSGTQWLLLCLSLLAGGLTVNELASRLFSRCRIWLQGQLPAIYETPHLRYVLAFVASLIVCIALVPDDLRARLLQWLGPTGPWVLGVGLVLALLAVWPEQRRMQYIALPLFLLLSLALAPLFDSPAAAVIAGMAWLAALLWRDERKPGVAQAVWHNPIAATLRGLAAFKPNSILGWIAFLVLLKFTVPLTILALLARSPLILLGLTVVRGRFAGLLVVGSCVAVLLVGGDSGLNLFLPLCVGLLASFSAALARWAYRRLGLHQVSSQLEGQG